MYASNSLKHQLNRFLKFHGDSIFKIEILESIAPNTTTLVNSFNTIAVAIGVRGEVF